MTAKLRSRDVVQLNVVHTRTVLWGNRVRALFDAVYENVSVVEVESLRFFDWFGSVVMGRLLLFIISIVELYLC